MLPWGMPSAPPAAPPLPFRFVAGDPALDLVNTVDWTDRGPVDERLTGYARLVEWAMGAGLASRREAASLLAGAAARPREGAEAYRLALEAREAIRRAATGAGLGGLNRLLARALPHLQLSGVPGPGRNGGRVRLAWRDADSALEVPVWGTVWSAARLLASDEAVRIRTCAGPDCGWMYVDRSRNGLRRWCEMATCGTREKSRRRREG